MKSLIIFILILLFSILLFIYFKSTSQNHHKSLPINSEGLQDPNETEVMIDNIKSSEYYKDLQKLNKIVKNKIVLNSEIGNKGFILFLNNDIWVMAYRDGNKILSDFGRNKPDNKIIALINSPEYGDASKGIKEDKIYANEFCDNKSQIIKSYNHRLEGLSFGESTFNFVFEDGMELDFQIVTDLSNKPAYRIFWEQW